MRVEWGIEWRKCVSGTQLAVWAFQVASLLPLAFLLAIVGYPAIVTTDNVLTAAFKLGMMAIPRIATIGLAHLYRITGSELAIHFALATGALAVGLVLGRLLQGSENVRIRLRQALAVLIAADIAMSLPPLPFNSVYGPGFAVAGIAVKLACLAFVILDLRAAKQA